MFGASFWVISVALIALAISGIRVVWQYEKGVKFRFGKFIGTVEPGLTYVFPLVENLIKVDMRVRTVDIPPQEVITKDNVSIKVNAVVYFKVVDAAKSVLEIENVEYAVAQYAQTALRDVIGNMELDEILSKREVIGNKIRKIVDEVSSDWGVDIVSVNIQDIQLPENMKRAMARQAEAEREKRATVIKSEGEVQASLKLKKAAEMLSKAPGALHLRTLQTINDISPDQSNTIVFVVPIEVLRAIEGFTKNSSKKRKKK
ncbi:MAG: slipin family protein [Candidatus Aenigmarchaeota archaeon]|nr:slipin family protein [Candidatus Aenigmarchaeota archaeon]